MPEETAVVEPEVSDAGTEDAEALHEEAPVEEESNEEDLEETAEATDEETEESVDDADDSDEEDDEEEAEAVISEPLFVAAEQLGVSRELAATFSDEQTLTQHLRSVSIAKAGSQPAAAAEVTAPEPFALTKFEMEVPANIEEYDEGAATLFKNVVAANEHWNAQFARIEAAVRRVEGLPDLVKGLGQDQGRIGSAMMALHFDRHLERLLDSDDDLAEEFGTGPLVDMEPDSKEAKRRGRLQTVYMRVRGELTREGRRFTEGGLLERAIGEMHRTRKTKGTLMATKKKAKKGPAKEPARAISRPTPRTATSSPGTFEEKRERCVGKIDQIMHRAGAK